MGQDEDWGGVFCNSDCRRHGEYQGGRYQKDDKGARGMCPGIKMFPKDFSWHGVSVPTHRGGHYLQCPCNSISLLLYIFSYGHNRFTVPRWGSCRFWRATNINPYDILRLIVDKKMEIYGSPI